MQTFSNFSLNENLDLKLEIVFKSGKKWDKITYKIWISLGQYLTNPGKDTDLFNTNVVFPTEFSTFEILHTILSLMVMVWRNVFVNTFKPAEETERGRNNHNVSTKESFTSKQQCSRRKISCRTNVRTINGCNGYLNGIVIFQIVNFSWSKVNLIWS